MDESEEGYEGPCLRVLDASFSSTSSSSFSSASSYALEPSSLERALAAGWHERGLRMSRAAQLFDEAHDTNLNVHEQVCADCVRALFAEYDSRLQDTVFFVAAYYKRLAEQPEEQQEEESNSNYYTAASPEQLSSLEAVESELAALLEEEKLLMRQETQMEDALLDMQHQHNAAKLERTLLVEQLVTEHAREASIAARLEEQKAVRVHEDVFSISRDRFEFPVINGFRLGSTQTHPIEWDEINAALGETALLLDVCARKLNFQFRTFRPVPTGAVSRMEHVTMGDAYSLAGSFRTAVMSSQFNTALGALLQATDQMAQVAGRKYGVKPPYKVRGERKKKKSQKKKKLICCYV